MPATGNEVVSLEQLKLFNDNVVAPIKTTADGALKAPTAAGTAGQVLSTDGTNTQWITIDTGEEYTGTAPIDVTGTVISIAAATTSAPGSMSAADKAKLNSVAEGANNYVLPIATDAVLGGVKEGEGVTIGEDGTISVDIPEVPTYTGTAPINVADTVISIAPASGSAAGSMSAADFTKLAGIEDGANNYVLPEASDTVMGGVKFASDTDFNAYMGIS